LLELEDELGDDDDDEEEETKLAVAFKGIFPITAVVPSYDTE